MYNPQKAADRIKSALADKGISAKKMCEDCNLGVNTISNIRNGDVKNVEIFTKIADYLDISLNWLCGLSEKKSDKLNTYADFYNLIIEISKVTDMYIFDLHPQYQSNVPVLYFNDTSCAIFFKDFRKMKALYDNGTIDDDIYNLWREKILSKKENQAQLGNADKLPDNEFTFNSDDTLPF
ncbi:MAG: helix-turn-helix transcriptional regulator [Clostridiales bacterium]|nr:helix-turn-helix transcriptional regulator [Clostridiales bacterium]